MIDFSSPDTKWLLAIIFLPFVIAMLLAQL